RSNRTGSRSRTNWYASRSAPPWTSRLTSVTVRSRTRSRGPRGQQLLVEALDAADHRIEVEGDTTPGGRGRAHPLPSRGVVVERDDRLRQRGRLRRRDQAPVLAVGHQLRRATDGGGHR